MTRSISITALVLAATCAVAHAASRPDPVGDPQRRAMLDAFLAGTPNQQDLSNGGGVTAQALAMVGREDLVMQSRIFKHPRRTCLPLQENGTSPDAVPYIAERAAKFRVTMVNEAHDMPQGRAFNSLVATALRPEGYSYYGGETFSDEIGATGPAWPLLTDGHFADEPIYGRLIRSLRKLGYRLFAYEFRPPHQETLSPDAQMDRREEAQAVSLEAHLRNVPENGKILVHVGYAHLNKTPLGPLKMMAARFRENTGIDPLTVDQTVFWSTTDSYAICDLSAQRVTDPTVIYVGAPKPSFTRGRPNWRLVLGDQFVDIPAPLRRPDEAAIYEARLASEPDTAVPIDRLLVRPGEDLPLLLPAGKYRLSVWTEKDARSAATPLVVN